MPWAIHRCETENLPPSSTSTLKLCLGACQFFCLFGLFCVYLFFFFGKGISVAERGTPFSQQVICGSWQTEGGIAILVQVTLRVNLRLRHMLLSVGAGLAECDWSIFSFLFSSTGWTYLCWWCWKAEDFACESFTSHLNHGSQAAGKHCYQKSICWPEREIAVLLDRDEAVPEQGLSGLGSEGDRAAGDQQGFAGTRRDRGCQPRRVVVKGRWEIWESTLYGGLPPACFPPLPLSFGNVVQSPRSSPTIWYQSLSTAA